MMAAFLYALLPATTVIALGWDDFERSPTVVGGLAATVLAILGVSRQLHAQSQEQSANNAIIERLESQVRRLEQNHQTSQASHDVLVLENATWRAYGQLLHGMLIMFGHSAPPFPSPIPAKVVHHEPTEHLDREDPGAGSPGDGDL